MPAEHLSGSTTFEMQTKKKKSNLPEASLYSLHVPFTELDRKKSIFDFFSTQIQMNERAAFRNEQKRRETRDSV